MATLAPDSKRRGNPESTHFQVEFVHTMTSTQIKSLLEPPSLQLSQKRAVELFDSQFQTIEDLNDRDTTFFQRQDELNRGVRISTFQ